MPYIKQEARDEIINGRKMAENPGELNYLLSELVYQYFQDNGGNYQAINDVVGALEGAKLEFYRRVAAPYEDRKIEENGDVYV
jgi:hypothetical protein